MKRRLLALALAAAFGAAALPAHGMDLLGAIRAASEIDPVVAAARAQLTAVRERVPQARAAIGPTLNSTATANQVRTDTTITAPRDFNSEQLGLLANLPLYRPALRVALEQSELNVQIAEAQLAQARQDLITRVAQAYFAVLTAQDALSVTRAQKRAIGEQFESARRNFEVGTATITDQQEAQARLDLTNAQEAAALNDLAVRRAALAQLVGGPVETLHTLRPDVDVRVPDAQSEVRWAEIARGQSFAVRQSEVTAEVARRQIDAQRYGNSPTLDLVGQLTHGRSTNAALQAALTGVRTTTGTIGLQLAFPIYNGGAVDARVREAIALQDRAQFDLESARRTAEQTARQTFLGVRSGLEQVRALTAAERSSQLALESNQLGYQVGVRINIDVLNAAQQLFSTRRDLANARYNVLLNGLQLRSVAGALTEEDVVAVNALLEPPRAESEAPAAAPAAAPPSLAPANVGPSSGGAAPAGQPAVPLGSSPGTARPGAQGGSTPGATPQGAARPGSPGVPAVRGGRSPVPVAPR
ncbi:MAG TPA: TolC family outer membrane protein [Burkholderiaceae bacterium]|nr:TolC family outer membrane protein [Burkholderiaceae bacterium]